MDVSIHYKWFDRRSDVKEFNEYIKRFDKSVYCAYDYDDGFYKVYKRLPYQLWGALGDYDGKGFYLYTIKTDAGNPRPPVKNDVEMLRRMEIKQASYAVRRQSNWYDKYNT